MRVVDYQISSQQAPKTDAPLSLGDSIELLDIEPTGPYVRLQNGDILCVEGENNANHQAWLSSDNGQSWKTYEIFDNEHFSTHDDHALCVAQSGRVYLSFCNTNNFYFNWIKDQNGPCENTRLDHYIVWSDDNGRSWQTPVLIQNGYAASARSLVELDDGTLVVSAQNLDYQNARHYALSFVSVDQGQSWQASNRIDMPGRGHHDGCYEGCILPLKDGRLWYLVRTNLDWFWHVYSEDQGLTWIEFRSGLAASSSPGMLTRLSSGRILLTYNPLAPTLGDSKPSNSRAGQFSQREASWYRGELLACLSDDEGASWSEPKVLARMDGAWLSYPHVFEAQTGEIWLTTMQSQLKLRFSEADLL